MSRKVGCLTKDHLHREADHLHRTKPGVLCPIFQSPQIPHLEQLIVVQLLAQIITGTADTPVMFPEKVRME